jgi:hypothetical protein
LEVEWFSVVAGVRRCGSMFVSASDLPALTAQWREHGLEWRPDPSISNDQTLPRMASPGLGGPKRVVVGRREDLAEFHEAWKRGDTAAVGHLLGYPACCLDFCRSVWETLGAEDTTWPMASAAGNDIDATVLESRGPAETNILWRSMGIRAVPHLPCRSDCSGSIALARKMFETGCNIGFQEEFGYLMDLLSWPVEWSALHGIAVIKTPVLKICTKTDSTPRKYTVRCAGSRYPVEGAQGLTFPYHMPAQPLLTLSPGFQRGLVNPIANLNGGA